MLERSFKFFSRTSTYKAPRLRINPAETFDRVSIVAFQRSGMGITAKMMSVTVAIAACQYVSATVTWLLTQWLAIVFSVNFRGSPHRNITKSMCTALVKVLKMMVQ
jgi:hypothetical protein